MTWQPKNLTREQLAERRAEALQLRKSTGRPPRLGETAKQALVKKLEEGAVAVGFPTEQWTQARVKQVIEREFGLFIIRITSAVCWMIWVGVCNNRTPERLNGMKT